jgi:thiamine biosynthesis lipoprotein
MVDSLMQLVGFTKINQQNNDLNSCYSKLNKSIALDFSALAKGYGIDVLANYLDKIRIDNYLIDIGGESRAKGVNKNGNNWTLGISKPTLDSNVNEYIRVISLNNKSIATSGNYRNYRKVGEKIYSHIINPKKGYYQYSNTLSVSVIAEDCMTADALATSFMILSREESKQIANRLKNVDVFFIYLDENQDIAFDFTPGFNQYIIQ